MRLGRLGLVAAVATALSTPPGALAHGLVESSDPQDGATVAQPPPVVSIEFTEAPAPESEFELLDGCGDDVLAEVTGEGRHAELNAASGEPGRWRARYQVVSGVDGHLTRGGLSFRVRGKADCGRQAPEDPSPEGTSEDDAAPPPSQPSDGEGVPVVPIAVAGAVILGGALAVRFLSAR